MASDRVRALAEKAVADYGFRQALLWGTEEVLSSWALDPPEAEAVRGRLLPAVEELPVPVEPSERPAVIARLIELMDAPP